MLVECGRGELKSIRRVRLGVVLELERDTLDDRWIDDMKRLDTIMNPMLGADRHQARTQANYLVQ